MQLTILGSGSNGNCSYLECGETRLLIDAGFSGRQIRQRLSLIGRVAESLTGILITHEHGDHISGLAGLAAKLRIPVYWNRATKEAAERQLETQFNNHIFTTGGSFTVGNFEIESFSVPHDAQDPVGFCLRAEGVQIGFLTDLGHATKLVLERVRGSDALVLETNHDIKLLQDDLRRPWSLKQRILSRHGHLSNEAAADTLETVLTDRLKKLFLGHLSRDCNRPELAERAVRKRLADMGAAHVLTEVTQQDHACATWNAEGRVASMPF